MFDVQHAAMFFGRDALTEWLLDAIRPKAEQSNRFLALLGASGSGKSSLARAGLLAQLKNGKLPDSQHWTQLILKPGAKPLESLAIALCNDPLLGKNQHPAELIQGLGKHDTQLHWLCRQALHGQPDTRRVVILVDQFEEVFTLCDQPAEREAFINNLLTAASDITGHAIVLLTMRADFFGKCAPFPQLAAALSDQPFLITPMTEAELRDTIVVPAQRCGYELETGLVEVLLQDVKNQIGSLPLLEYALSRLWEKSTSRTLRLQDYQDMGGLTGALNQRANELYAELSPEQQTLCQQIFLRLVQPGEGTEDTRRRANLHEFGDDTQKVIQKLATARLITTLQTDDKKAYAEVAHEALIRNWAQLRSWIEQDREALRMQHQLSAAAEAWAQNQRDAAYLLNGSRLQRATEWLAKHEQVASELERGLILASKEAAKQQREQAETHRQEQLKWKQQRKQSVYVLIGLMVALGLAGWGFSERGKAKQAQADLTGVTLDNLLKGHQPVSPYLKDVYARGQQDALFVSLKSQLAQHPALTGTERSAWGARLAKMTQDQMMELIHLLNQHDDPLEAKKLTATTADFAVLAQEIALPPPVVSASVPDMVSIPAGSFMMGCQDGRDMCWGDNEKPAHKVQLAAFEMSKYEVTQGQWKAVMGTNPSFFKNCGNNCPVENVGWDDIQLFLQKLNAQTGKTYRLPTEAEWEYACRAGKDSPYCGGGHVSSGVNWYVRGESGRDRVYSSVAWYDDNSERQTHVVGRKQPNAFGIYDMSGNVSEWNSSRYQGYPYRADDGREELKAGDSRVVRGGSCLDSDESAAHRDNNQPGRRSGSIGFRVVLRSSPVSSALH